MMDVKILIEKYKKGNLSKEEMVLLEKAIEKDEVHLDELGDTTQWLDRVSSTKELNPSEQLDNKFYGWLEKENTKALTTKEVHITWWQGVAAAIILLAGIGIGALLDQGQKYESQISELTRDMYQMQEIMMSTLLKEGSTSDRLKAVSYTYGIPELSDKVSRELLYALNNDENVNVRLATVEALARYTDNPKVRAGLIKSINKQESPLVQMALIELMVAMRESSSVKELQKLIDKRDIAPEVKTKAEEGIDILI